MQDKFSINGRINMNKDVDFFLLFNILSLNTSYQYIVELYTDNKYEYCNNNYNQINSAF